MLNVVIDLIRIVYVNPLGLNRYIALTFAIAFMLMSWSVMYLFMSMWSIWVSNLSYMYYIKKEMI